jgi:hypothetical protein
MTTYTWTIENLYTQTIADEADYVVIVNYLVVGVDGEFEASLTNLAQFSTENVETFIPYADLTNEIVVGWVQSVLGIDGVANLEACIQGQIESLINPPVSPVNTPLPF